VVKGKRRAKAGAAGRGKKNKRKGHGRNGADAYTGAKHLAVPHESLKPGARCPQSGCRGKVYKLCEPGTIVRIKGLPPLPATVYELEKLRCNLCGTVFTAKAPEGVGEKKYDETTASMIALLKYGAGLPFHRLETLENHLGIPLPAATQWDIVSEAAQACAPAWETLIEEAAQGEVLHNDDTPWKILELMAENQAHEPGKDPPERTGLFTTGVVSKRGEHLMAPFFTGRNHAGENLKAVLAQRSQALSAPSRCAMGSHATSPESARRSSPTASVTGAGASWTWRRTSPGKCATCWRAWLRFTKTTPWPAGRSSRHRSGSNSIEEKASP
jgi:transposase